LEPFALPKGVGFGYYSGFNLAWPTCHANPKEFHMNRAELIDALAARSDVSKATADKVLTELLAVIGEALVAGDKLTLVGFGSY
jgi:hypothetical protein